MEKEFVPYLGELVPALFEQAALKPKASVEGEEGDILQFLSEIKVSEDGAKGLNIVTGETDDKNVAIQMLTVFIDELEEGFAPYIR